MKTLLLILIFCTLAIAKDTHLKSKVEAIRASYELPSLSGAYTNNLEVKKIVSTGLRRIDQKTKIKTSDKFHLGSCGKAMTATLVALLVDEGKLKWNQSISELLPNISVHADVAKLSFDHLLVHRSGVRRDTEDFENGWLYTVLESGLYTPPQARELIAQKVLVNKPQYRPKEKMHYSNVGYMIIGHIIEQVTNKSFEDLIQLKIFNPLNMKSCGFGAVSQFKNQPWGHTIIADKLIPIDDDNPPAFSPAGTIHCNLSDWSKFLRMQMNGYNKKSDFLSQASFKKLFTHYPDKKEKYAYGAWNKTTREWANGEVFQHSGTNTYNFANVWFAPNVNSALMGTSTISSRDAFLGTDKAISELIKQFIKK